ncbi:hypothetical protein NMG60_11031831 [Bertholletia excelsa]
MDGLTALPDNCICTILSKTSRRDACKCSAISKPIKKLADSDDVWSVFLPSDYQEIILRCATPVVYSCLKQLYLSLSDSPILLEGENMSFFLEKESGKKCVMLGARSLRIVWGDHPEYWEWMSLSHSRFPEVARLRIVCWLEITGRVDTQLLSPNTTYAAYLVYNLESTSYGLESLPIKGWIRFAGESGDDRDEIDPNTVYLKLGSSEPAQMPGTVFLPRKRKDGWLEIELGEIFNDQEIEREVEMRFLGSDGLYGKSGLVVEGFELRPKGNPQVN